MHFVVDFWLFASVLCLVSDSAAEKSFYQKNRHILELNHRTFDDYVFESNHTSIIEFYAPWCGYCKQFKPEFKKAAGLANSFAQFGAVNCDLEGNKQLCANMNIKGFPTIKVFKPPKSFHEDDERTFQFITDVYSGERDANRLVDHVKGKVRNLTKKIVSSKLPSLLKSGSSTVLLITDAQTVPPLYKGLAIDFDNYPRFLYTTAASKKARDDIKDILGIEEKLKGNTLVYISEDGTVTVHDGLIDRESMGEFLSQFSEPLDGPQSERYNVIMGLKSGKFKTFTQYEKLKRKKQRKMKKQQQMEEASLEEERGDLPLKDEL